MTVLFALSACGPYPRDIAGTTDRVLETRELRVGFGQMPPGSRVLAQRFVARLAADTGAKPVQARIDSEEALFGALEHGDLDLAVVEIAGDSPWLAEVAVIEPMHRRRAGQRTLGLSPVAANGENRWVMMLERAVRDTDAGR